MKSILISRLLIAIVTAWNIQAVLAFLLWPDAYAPGFELGGVAGAAAVRGTAVLFLMWNVPYFVALWHPQKYKLVLGIALVMQTVGVIGESLILAGLPAGHAILSASLLRFIAFDGAGLIMLLGAFLLTRINHENE